VRIFGAHLGCLVVVSSLQCSCSGAETTHAGPVPAARAPNSSSAIQATTRPLALPHPKLEELRRTLSAAIEADAEGEPLERLAPGGWLDAVTCAMFTGFELKDGPDIEQCDYELLANGTALAITPAWDCGAHTCSTRSYVWYGRDRAPYELTASDLEVSPDHRYLLSSSFSTNDEPPFTPIAGETWSFERSTGKRRKLFDCFSTRLSPRGRYYVCRDLGANVLRVPVTGGPLQLVAKAALPPATTVKLGGPFNDYPGRVQFIDDHTLEYEVFVYETDQVTKYRAPWRE
jgi:hypothetical protein